MGAIDMYILEQLIETTDQAINIIKIKTAELESAQKAIDDAKAYLRAKGVEYVGVKSDPDLDMNDPKNWQTGDILVCICEDASDEFFSLGGKYPLLAVSTGGSRVYIYDNEYELNSWESENFKFHFRPSH